MPDILHDFNRICIYGQIFVKVPNMKHSRKSMLWDLTDARRQTEMMKQIEAFFFYVMARKIRDSYKMLE